MEKDKKAPILKPDVKKDQNVGDQDHPKTKNRKNLKDQPEKNDPKKVPESNDPAGYSEKGDKKQSPSGQRNN